MRVLLSAIRLDPEAQLRGGIDHQRVSDMLEFVQEGGVLPPILLINGVLADGHHRLEVARAQRATDIEANVQDGDIDDVIVAAISHNDTAASKPLSAQERNKGIRSLLQHGKTQKWIGVATGVTQQAIGYVASNLRAVELLTELKAQPTLAAEVARVGRVNVGRAGGTPDPTPEVLEIQHALAAEVKARTLNQLETREAVRLINRDVPVHEAVERVRPTPPTPVPTGVNEVVPLVLRAVRGFLDKPVTVDGVQYVTRDIIQLALGMSDHPALRGRYNPNSSLGDEMAQALASLRDELDSLVSVPILRSVIHA